MKTTRDIINFLLLIVLVSSCTYNIRNTRLIPEYDGVDPKIAPFANEYQELAKQRGLFFDRKITIGFKNINKGAIIGETNYSYFFREIDIDFYYWEYATPMSKMTLIFHELSHGYCERDHDWDAGKNYEDKDIETGGFFEDSCAKSIMFPQIITDECFQTHYQEYVDEMFQRCRPY